MYSLLPCKQKFSSLGHLKGFVRLAAIFTVDSYVKSHKTSYLFQFLMIRVEKLAYSRSFGLPALLPSAYFLRQSLPRMLVAVPILANTWVVIKYGNVTPVFDQEIKRGFFSKWALFDPSSHLSQSVSVCGSFVVPHMIKCLYSLGQCLLLEKSLRFAAMLLLPVSCARRLSHSLLCDVVLTPFFNCAFDSSSIFFKQFCRVTTSSVKSMQSSFFHRRCSIVLVSICWHMAGPRALH